MGEVNNLPQGVTINKLDRGKPKHTPPNFELFQSASDTLG